MEALLATNMEQTQGYGVDEHCEHARELIREKCGKSDADVNFLVGGTQTNVTVIASILKPYQGVVCADSGHINVHETGAVEAAGHKVLALSSTDGKISAAQIEEIYISHMQDGSREHMVQPGLVYISQPTEIGTLYTKEELTAISDVCRQSDIPLFLDGARLGYGLAAQGNDVTLEDIAELCDVFYIGGTKVGALFGEAVVITKENLKKDFRYNIKQRGGMLAKGRLLGIQFEELFRDDLYMEISSHADRLAMKIKKAFQQKGIPFAVDSNTNQQFPVLNKNQADKLAEKYTFDKNDHELENGPSKVRFCTSWATKEENVDALVQDIMEL